MGEEILHGLVETTREYLKAPDDEQRERLKQVAFSKRMTFLFINNSDNSTNNNGTNTYNTGPYNGIGYINKNYFSQCV